MIVLDFEKPLMEMQEKIKELKKISLESGMDLDKEIETFEQQAEDYRKDLYSNLKPSQKLQIARHPERPNFMDYVNKAERAKMILCRIDDPRAIEVGNSLGINLYQGRYVQRLLSQHSTRVSFSQK